MYSVGDVTIIIPVYCNTQEKVEWFKECLLSALSQGSKIVIVDDASPISIHDVIRDNWDDVIRVIQHTTNAGVSIARNVAVSQSETNLIFPLDSDDTLRDGAISELVAQFTGIPLYPDIAKFGAEIVPHYQLLEFSCEVLYQKVGISSVNVLHTKEQWAAIGGWKRDVHFYEDGEYNARLMLTYCGKRYPVPLVNYRQHAGQRTVLHKGESAQQGRKILSMIKEYNNMGCCGGKRTSGKNASAMAIASEPRRGREMNVQDLPGTKEGRILAQYIGSKGAGKHYYRGPVTKYPYHVIYGGYYYVDPADAKEPVDRTGNSLFVRMYKQEPVTVKQEPVTDDVKRKPREVPNKRPVPVMEKIVEEPESEEAEEALPDIHNMRWLQEIRHMEPSPEVAEKLLKMEKRGKQRVKVMKHLKKFVGK